MSAPRKKTPGRKPRAAKPRTVKSRQPRFNGPRWLKVIDNEPIRGEALKEYQQLEEEIKTVKEQLEAFESGDLPAYQRWQVRAFGPLLTELRTTLQGIDEKRAILLEIEEEMFWGRCSETAAYRRVMKRRTEPASEADFADEESGAHGERGPEEEPEEGGGQRMFENSDLPPDFDIDEFDRMSARMQKKYRDDYEAMAAIFAMMTGRLPPDFDDLLERERVRTGKADPKQSTRTTTEEAVSVNRPEERLKELYRKLVRQLHPDTAQELTEREKELWHEVQEAYRAKDLERMEAVAGRIEIGLGGNALHLSLQILRRMTRDLKDALKGLKSRTSSNRKHPAWSFRSKAAQLAKLEAKHRRKLMKDLNDAKAELAALSTHLEAIAAQAKSPRKGSQKRRKVENFSEFRF